MDAEKEVIQMLLKDNYDSIVDRGLIKPGKTTIPQFCDKIVEEVEEFETSEELEECADIALASLNCLVENLGVNGAIKMLRGKIEVNKTRAKYGL